MNSTFIKWCMIKTSSLLVFILISIWRGKNTRMTNFKNNYTIN